MSVVNQILENAVEHHQAGRLAEAEALCRQSLAQTPDHTGAMLMLGVLAHQQGRTEEGLRWCDQAIAANPAIGPLHHNRAVMLLELGRFDEAILAGQASIALEPTAEAYSVIGYCYHTRGMLEQAIAAYQEAAAVNPNYADAFNNIGACFHGLGRLDEAQIALQQSLALNPQNPYALNNLGNVLKNLGKIEEAIGCFGQAVLLSPQYAEAYNNLGVALKTRGDYDPAMIAYRQAIALKPNYAVACNNLGAALLECGQLDDALTCFSEAVALTPNFNAAHSSRCFTLHFHPKFDTPAIAAELRQFHDRHAAPLRGQIRPHDNDPSPDRPLRIGFISPDFRDHCQAHFILPLFSNLDRANFQIFCYSDTNPTDPITARLARHADEWKNIVGQTDGRVAQTILHDKIDILVDLTMHMSGNRQLVIARKPAPLQITWLAYPGSTGLQTIDYRFTDPHLDPPGMFEQFYFEKSLRLPDTFWCYDPAALAPDDWQPPLAGPLPALRNDYITFGSLNNFFKLTDATLDLWRPVLNSIPDSRLILLAPRGLARTELLKKFESRGVAPARIQIVERLPRNEYLRLYQQIDIGLDTTPYNGHTTSLDSYWMGVPVVTLVGNTVVGRAGWSQLNNLGLADLAARTPQHFARIACTVASNLPRLDELRLTLRERMQRSALMDAPRFARNMENAYRHIWRQWCQASR
jgi:predicted O-linked N-acetylglucosamine transferase (SPINDLY family)